MRTTLGTVTISTATKQSQQYQYQQTTTTTETMTMTTAINGEISIVVRVPFKWCTNALQSKKRTSQHQCTQIYFQFRLVLFLLRHAQKGKYHISCYSQLLTCRIVVILFSFTSCKRQIKIKSNWVARQSASIRTMSKERIGNDWECTRMWVC